MIEATKSEGREIILIIDEAHTHVSTTLAQKIVDIIDPKIVLHVSATPDKEISLSCRTQQLRELDRAEV